MKIILLISLLFLGCYRIPIARPSKIPIPNHIVEGYHYKAQESERYAAYYYWHKFPSIALCGYYILDKKINKKTSHLIDYPSCEYETEDAYSISHGKMLTHFRSEFKTAIQSIQTEYFPSDTEQPLLLSKETHHTIEPFFTHINIHFLEVINVRENDQLHVRTSPSRDATILRSLPNKSKKLFGLKEKNIRENASSWMKVYYFDEDDYAYKEGWVYRRYLHAL